MEDPRASDVEMPSEDEQTQQPGPPMSAPHTDTFDGDREEEAEEEQEEEEEEEEEGEPVPGQQASKTLPIHAAGPSSAKKKGVKRGDELTFAELALPTSRVRRIMKADYDVQIMTKDAVDATNIATVHFIKELIRKAYESQTAVRKRKTVAYRDLNMTIDLSADLAFLDGVVPAQMPVEDAIAVRQKVKQSLGMSGSFAAPAHAPPATSVPVAPTVPLAPLPTAEQSEASSLSLKLKQSPSNPGTASTAPAPAQPSAPSAARPYQPEEEEEDRPLKMSRVDPMPSATM